MWLQEPLLKLTTFESPTINFLLPIQRFVEPASPKAAQLGLEIFRGFYIASRKLFGYMIEDTPLYD